MALPESATLASFTEKQSSAAVGFLVLVLKFKLQIYRRAM